MMWSSDIQTEVHHLQKEQNSTCALRCSMLEVPKSQHLSEN